MKILFVEDHAVFAATVQAEFLRGHEVCVVATIAEALDALGTTSFDAVLVDYDLADGKGDAFVRNMRERGHRTPLVAVSAKDEGNERLLAAGADAICSKSRFRHIGKVLERLSPSPTESRDALDPGPDTTAAALDFGGSGRLIRFYGVGDPHGELSNFARYPILLDKKWWPTSEHYFQAQKFLDPKVRESIRTASTPMMAARLGRDRRQKLRGDWESAKVSVMREAVEAKFRQHEDLARLLLSTGDATLVEHTDADAFWGDGGDRSGKNMLGRILMEVRAVLQRERGFRA